MKTSRKAIILSSLFAGVILLSPATFLFIRDVWVAEVTADRNYRDAALILLAEDAFYSRDRMYRMKWLVEPKRSNVGYAMPIRPENAVSTPEPFLPIRFPTCHGPIFISDAQKLRKYRALGFPFQFRIRTISRARFQLIAQRVGALRLSLSNACMQATPFAESCGDWLDRQNVDHESVIGLLEKEGNLRRTPEGFCWPEAELAEPSKGNSSAG